MSDPNNKKPFPNQSKFANLLSNFFAIVAVCVTARFIGFGIATCLIPLVPPVAAFIISAILSLSAMFLAYRTGLLNVPIAIGGAVGFAVGSVIDLAAYGVTSACSRVVRWLRGADKTQEAAASVQSEVSAPLIVANADSPESKSAAASWWPKFCGFSWSTAAPASSASVQRDEMGLTANDLSRPATAP